MILPVAVAIARYKHAQWSCTSMKTYNVPTRDIEKNTAPKNFIGLGIQYSLVYSLRSSKITVKCGPPRTGPTGQLLWPCVVSQYCEYR